MTLLQEHTRQRAQGSIARRHAGRRNTALRIALLAAWLTTAGGVGAQGAATATPKPQPATAAADVYFAADSDQLSPEAVATLRGLAQAAKGIRLEVIIAVGHADATEKLPEPLSVRRAEAAKTELVAQGIAAGRVYTEGKGASSPVADNKTAAGRAKNRRVELEAVGTR